MFMFGKCSFSTQDFVKGFVYDNNKGIIFDVRPRERMVFRNMNWLRRFMTGRYGSDQLNIALMVLYLILVMIEIFVQFLPLAILTLLLIFMIIFRMLSRNYEKRRKENAAFLRVWNPIQRCFSGWLFRVKDTSHRYIRCKKCKERLRLPRGKGRIEVTCPKCRERFITRT